MASGNKGKPALNLGPVAVIFFLTGHVQGTKPTVSAKINHRGNARIITS